MTRQHRHVRHAMSRVVRVAVPGNIRAWRVLFRYISTVSTTNVCLVVRPMQHPKTKVAVIVIKIQVSTFSPLTCFLPLKLKLEIKRFMIICCYNFFFLSFLIPSYSHTSRRSLRMNFSSPCKIHCFYLSLTHPRRTFVSLSLTVPLKWKFIVVFKGFKSFIFRLAYKNTKCYAVTFFLPSSC